MDAKNVQWYYEQADVTETGVLFTMEFEVNAEESTGEEFAVQVKLSNDLAANFSNYNFDAVDVDFKGGTITIQTDTPTPAAQFVIEGVPTTNGGNPINAANPGTISAITVPVRYFGVGEQVTEIAAAFYDVDGRFTGFGMTTATVNDQTNAVAIPVRQYADRLKMLKIMMLNTSLAPLISASSYDLP